MAYFPASDPGYQRHFFQMRGSITTVLHLTDGLLWEHAALRARACARVGGVSFLTIFLLPISGCYQGLRWLLLVQHYECF